jgi:hypothetical protein
MGIYKSLTDTWPRSFISGNIYFQFFGTVSRQCSVSAAILHAAGNWLYATPSIFFNIARRVKAKIKEMKTRIKLLFIPSADLIHQDLVNHTTIRPILPRVTVPLRVIFKHIFNFFKFVLTHPRKAVEQVVKIFPNESLCRQDDVSENNMKQKENYTNVKKHDF